MKKLIFIICVGLTIAACKKNHQDPATIPPGYVQTDGVLLGLNEGMCPEPSCGGMKITIKNDPTKNPSPVYLINQTLLPLKFTDSTKFPINVSLSWKRDTGVYGSFNYIVVYKIQLIK